MPGNDPDYAEWDLDVRAFPTCGQCNVSRKSVGRLTQHTQSNKVALHCERL
jgi:hypothetical protein